MSETIGRLLAVGNVAEVFSFRSTKTHPIPRGGNPCDSGDDGATRSRGVGRATARAASRQRQRRERTPPCRGVLDRLPEAPPAEPACHRRPGARSWPGSTPTRRRRSGYSDCCRGASRAPHPDPSPPLCPGSLAPARQAVWLRHATPRCRGGRIPSMAVSRGLSP
jgi:hypothetical protein